MENAESVLDVRRPADALHDVRERISELRDREQQLRAGFVSGALDPVGDDFTVIIEVKPNERIDLGEMREHIPEEVWKPFLVERPVTYVNVRRKP